MRDGRKGCLKATAVVIALLVTLLVGSCQMIRYGEMRSKANQLPFAPGYFDFVAWDVCDRLFGGGGYIVRIPPSYNFDRDKLVSEGWNYQELVWDGDGMTGLMCLKSHQVDGISVPYEAFSGYGYVRHDGRTVDFMVPERRIGLGGEDPR